MRRALLARLERLEARPEASKPLLLRCGWVHHLPDDYPGERHIVTVRRDRTVRRMSNGANSKSGRDRRRRVWKTQVASCISPRMK
jgi:hypothetical protein